MNERGPVCSGRYGLLALDLDGFCLRCSKQFAGLVIADCRCLAFAAFEAAAARFVAPSVFIGAAGADIADVGKPLDLGRFVGEPMKLGFG